MVITETLAVGGLDLSRSQSQHLQKVSLISQDNLDRFKSWSWSWSWQKSLQDKVSTEKLQFKKSWPIQTKS